VDRDPVRPVHRLLSVRRGLLLSVRQAEGLGSVAGIAGFAGFALCDGGFRPFYGWLSEYIGRRRTMIYAYSGNVISS